MDPVEGLALQWIFGALVVVLYADDRFRSPHSMRATTTFLRYWLAWSGYATAMLVLFIVLGGTFTDSAALLELLGISKTVEPGEAPPGPLLAALTLTSLLPHAPVLCRMDEAVRKWFQRVGNIPYEVRALSARLRSSPVYPSAEVLDKLAPTLRAHNVERDWLRASSETVGLRWARCVALWAGVQHWEDARGYARYVDESKTALGEIRVRLAALSEFLEPQVVSELDRASDSALVARMRKNVSAELAALDRALCDFISGGVLSGGRSHAQRHAALTRLGFSGLSTSHDPLNANDIVLVAGLVFLALLFIPLMLRRFFYPEALDMKFRILVMVPVIYAIAITLAIYPKSMWEFARRRTHDQRPVAAYALSGALAAVAAFIVALVFRFAFPDTGTVLEALATPGAFSYAWQGSLERWPWQLMIFMVTVAIAWAADDYLPDAAMTPRWLRSAEAGALAVVVCSMQSVVVYYLPEMKPREPQLLITAFTIGLCIGWFVPHWYRSKGRCAAGTAPETTPGGATDQERRLHA